jgi:glycosyltransferase involved in cell wall biosynthesis
MRILLVNSFYYRRGGAEVHFLELEQLLSKRGHEVAVFAMHHPENLPSAWSRYWVPQIEYRGGMSGAHRIRAFARSIGFRGSRAALRELVADFRPQVAHLHAIHHHLTLSVVEELRSLEVPSVWTLHDYRTVCPATHLLRRNRPCEQCAGGAFWRGLAGRCKSRSVARSLAAVIESYRSRSRGLHSMVDCYVAPSEFLSSKIRSMGLPAARIEIIPNFVDSGDAKELPQDGAESTRVDKEDFGGLLYVGRLSVEKGIDTVLRAVAGLPVRRFRIIGTGPSETDLRAEVERLGLAAQFLGWRDRGVVLAAMRDSDLLVFPSRAYENCPIVLLEAMTQGLPIVASGVGGIPEILDNGRCGRLVPPGDEIAWRREIVAALSDPADGTRRAEAARQRVRSRHGVDSYAARIEQVYASLQGT